MPGDEEHVIARCPSCGALVDQTADDRCPECSLPIKVSCPDCGAKVPADEDECPQCGTSLAHAADLG